MPTRSLRTFLLCVCLSVTGVITAEDKSHDKIDVTEMTELPVVLTDEDGQPVAGANVMPYAMRLQVRSGHGYWNQEVYGLPKWYTSDEEGVAIIEYPGHVQIGPDVFTTRLVTFQIVHRDFVREVVHFDLGPERARVQLKPGCEVRLSSVDLDGNRVEDFGVAVAGPFEPDVWARDDAGGRRTRSISAGTWQAMLIKLQDDGPTLFSDVLSLRADPKQAVQLRDIRLTPGAGLTGRLSDNVSRPVKGGYVVATSVPQPAGNSWDEKNPSLIWHDWVDVAEDGTFEFDSLPRGGEVQLIGICEGWVSTTTAPKAPQVFVMGQIFDGDDNVVNVDLQMEATGTLKVEVVTRDGKLLTEGRVSSWPNQKYYKGGSTVLGRKIRSDLRIRNQLLPVDQRTSPFRRLTTNFPFMQQLDEKGVAVLTGIPIGRKYSISLSHDKWKLENRAGRANRVSFQLQSNDPGTLKVTAIAATSE